MDLIDEGLTNMQRQLLMVDDDLGEIMDDRDSVKMGQFMINEKLRYQA